MREMVWRQFRIERESRQGFLLVLPCFEDEEHPEAAFRMNRFYKTAANNLYAAALDAVTGKSERVFYRCEPEVEEENGAVAVTLCLSLSVAGERTKRKRITHVWRDGEAVETRSAP